MPKGFRAPLLVCIGIAAGGGAMHDAVSAEPQRSITPSATGGERQSASNSLQRLDYAILPAGRVVIKLVFRHELKERPPVIAGYHPTANIVLDFADTASDLGKDPVDIGQREVRGVQVLPIGTRARVIITLNQPVSYEISLAGRELLLTLDRRRAVN